MKKEQKKEKNLLEHLKGALLESRVLAEEDLFEKNEDEDAVFETLKGEAYKQDYTSYKRKYRDHEIEELKQEFVSENIRLLELEKDFKEVKDEWANKIKPVQARADFCLTAIKTEIDENEGTIFYFKNDITGKMYLYDRKGRFISSRKLLDSEKQLRINLD